MSVLQAGAARAEISDFLGNRPVRELPVKPLCDRSRGFDQHRAVSHAVEDRHTRVLIDVVEVGLRWTNPVILQDVVSQPLYVGLLVIWG